VKTGEELNGKAFGGSSRERKIGKREDQDSHEISNSTGTVQVESSRTGGGEDQKEKAKVDGAEQWILLTGQSKERASFYKKTTSRER